MRGKLLCLSLFLILFLVLPISVLAYNAAILGQATGSATPSIAPTAEGPGLILPDSPFFFLDKLKQKIRVVLAFLPEDKARVHVSIAGERLAELRIMLARGNQKGIRIDLSGISENLADVADDMSQAQLSGRDIKDLARTLNNSIKMDQDALDSLAAQVTGDLKAQVNLVQSVAFRAKLTAGDSLPADLQQNELLDDLTRRATEQVQLASDSAASIQNTLDELSKQTQLVATSSSKINAAKILQLQSVAIGQARSAATASENAAVSFKQAEDAINQLRAPQTTITIPLK